MTFLLLGEAPNNATIGAPELWLLPDNSGVPHTANRLRELAGYSHGDYRRVFSARQNVLAEPPSKWNAAIRRKAREGAEVALEAAQRLRALGVVCLGRRAMDAVTDGRKTIAFDWTTAQAMTDLEPIRVVYVPHTSGRNLWWNEPVNQRAAGAFFGKLLRDTNRQ